MSSICNYNYCTDLMNTINIKPKNAARSLAQWYQAEKRHSSQKFFPLAARVWYL